MMKNTLTAAMLAAAMLLNLPAIGKTYYFDNYSTLNHIYREARIIIDEGMAKMTVKMQTASMKWQTAELAIVKKTKDESGYNYELKDVDGISWRAYVGFNDDYIALFGNGPGTTFMFSSPYKVIR